jgi:hypothetical protein
MASSGQQRLRGRCEVERLVDHTPVLAAAFVPLAPPSMIARRTPVDNSLAAPAWLGSLLYDQPNVRAVAAMARREDQLVRGPFATDMLRARQPTTKLLTREDGAQAGEQVGFARTSDPRPRIGDEERPAPSSARPSLARRRCR